MNNSTELRTVVTSVLLNQIQFGVCHGGDKLPTIEETSTQLHVSVDTARAAYLKLKEQGYITLSKNVGATVKVRYNAEETEEFIQTFFSVRKNAMTDLGLSMKPLFGNAQWYGLKNISMTTLQAMEQLNQEKDAKAPYAMLKQLNQKYASLGNSLLMRLAWQTFMFLHNPFLSIEDNLQYFDGFGDYVPKLSTYCREKDWPSLRTIINESIDMLSLSLNRFYKARITMPSPEKEITFTWSSYKKSQQLCYSLAMELLLSISQGVYPPGSLLPSQKELAEQKGVSVSTVRRALELLHSVGAIKSYRYVGTQVLPFDQATANSDFTKPVLQRRLVDMAESIQVFTLSCRDVSRLTLSHLDARQIQELCSKIKLHKKRQRGETFSYFIINLIAQHAPYQAIRTVYSELLRQFFWAYALRGMNKEQDTINAIYDPYYDKITCALEKGDHSRFSVVLEELMLHEFRQTMDSLFKLKIPGAGNILIPDEA
ncbi:MAG: GntR family transcriptional regulator [Eubacteriales bacterium]|nr:GntR family transcriptional regulator [Eubacteriales bacterium]